MSIEVITNQHNFLNVGIVIIPYRWRLLLSIAVIYWKYRMAEVFKNNAVSV